MLTKHPQCGGRAAPTSPPMVTIAALLAWRTSRSPLAPRPSPRSPRPIDTAAVDTRAFFFERSRGSAIAEPNLRRNPLAWPRRRGWPHRAHDGRTRMR